MRILIKKAVINMPCVIPDGKSSETGIVTQKAVQGGADTTEAVQAATGKPLFKIRSGLRDLVKAEFLEFKG